MHRRYYGERLTCVIVLFFVHIFRDLGCNCNCLYSHAHTYMTAISDQFGYIADGVADALLLRYRPILQLHPLETSFPCRIEWYLQRVSMGCTHEGAAYGVLSKAENVHVE